MGILFWYRLRSYAKVFLMCMSALLTVYLVVDFFEKLRKFLDYDAELSIMLAYLFYKIPEISFKLAPLAALMATILTLGGLNKNHEITAMRSCGISFYQIATPFIAFGSVLTLVLFNFAAVIIPLSNLRAEHIRTVLIEKKPKALSLTTDLLWLRLSQNALLRIGAVEPDGRRLHEISLYRMDQEFQLQEITEAKEAYHTQDRWLLSQATRRQVKENGNVIVDSYESLSFNLPLAPQDFQTWLSIKPENLTLRQLSFYVSRLKRDGHNSDRLLTDYWARIAFSGVTMIMTILGIALSLLKTGTRGMTVARGIGQALGIGFLFWTMHSFGIVLGRNGALMPIMVAWIASLMFLSVGLNLFLKMR